MNSDNEYDNLQFLDNAVYNLTDSDNEDCEEIYFDNKAFKLKEYLKTLGFNNINIIDEISHHFPRFFNAFIKKDIDKRKCQLNGEHLYLQDPVYIINSNFVVCKDCVLHIL